MHDVFGTFSGLVERSGAEGGEVRLRSPRRRVRVRLIISERVDVAKSARTRSRSFDPRVTLQPRTRLQLLRTAVWNALGGA